MQPDRGRDLDRELWDLGPRVEYPPTPDLASSVRGRLESESGGPGSPARPLPQFWWIAAAALFLLVAVPVLSLAIRGMGGGASSVGGSAAEGGAVEEDRGGTDDVAERETPSSMAAESGVSSTSAEAACFSPEAILEAQPSRGAPGDEFSIRGKNFVADLGYCDDNPARNVRVEFLQDGKTWKLGSVEADKGLRIAAKLEVPAGAGPGRATVRATYGQGPPEAPYGRVSAEARFSVLD